MEKSKTSSPIEGGETLDNRVIFMAQSPSHKFGQLIGNLLESIMQPLLQEFCTEHELYLDYQGKKRASRRGKKVSWQDDYGNMHDLDYVIEKDGTDKIVGQHL